MSAAAIAGALLICAIVSFSVGFIAGASWSTLDFP